MTDRTRHFLRARRDPQLVHAISASTTAISPSVAQAPKSARSRCRKLSRFKPVIAWRLYEAGASRVGSLCGNPGVLGQPEGRPTAATPARVAQSNSSSSPLFLGDGLGI